MTNATVAEPMSGLVMKGIDEDNAPALLWSARSDWVGLFHEQPTTGYYDGQRPLVGIQSIRFNARSHMPDGVRVFGRVELRNLGHSAHYALSTPADSAMYPIGFSPDGRYLAFILVDAASARLALVECGSQRYAVLPQLLNATCLHDGEVPARWCPDSDRIACHLVVENRLSAACLSASVPTIYESVGEQPQRTTVRPLSVHEHEQFNRHFASQVALFRISTDSIEYVNGPAYIRRMSVSPCGTHLLVNRYNSAADAVGRALRKRTTSEVWSCSGVFDSRQSVTLPSCDPDLYPADDFGTEGRWFWHPFSPETVVAVQRAGTSYVLVSLSCPFEGEPRALLTTACRLLRCCWTERGTLIWLEQDLQADRVRLSTQPPNGSRVVVWDLPVSPAHVPWRPWRVESELRTGESAPLWKDGRADGVVIEDDDGIALVGVDTSASHERSFVERLDTMSGNRRRMWLPDGEHSERVAGVLPGGAALTIVESRVCGPRYQRVSLRTGARTSIGPSRQDPGPTGSIVLHTLAQRSPSPEERDLSIYVAAEHHGDRPMPTVIWLYPQLRIRNMTFERELRNLSPRQYVGIDRVPMWPGGLLFQGYAICSLPYVPIYPLSDDDPDELRRDLVAGIERTCDTLIASGQADPDRLAVAGYCVGAYAAVMVAALTKRFRAAIACGGLYNLAIKPLGSYLTANHTFWKRPALYSSRSAVSLIPQINVPLLLIHGEEDRQSPCAESRDLFVALSLRGATVRYVSVPFEGHEFARRESRMIYQTEIVQWCQRHVGA